MKYRFIDWNLKDDNNNGLIFGIEEDVDFPEYVEWFETIEEREIYALENGLEVLKWK